MSEIRRSLLPRIRDQGLRFTLPLASWLQGRALADLPAVTEWLDGAVGEQKLTVSIVMPTRNRASVLPRALDSVLAQRHPYWELVVVDDGSEDGTDRVLSGYTDQRIRAMHVRAGGCATARNVALDAASGDAVVYLDDDNVMHPLWLHAVAWAFSTFTDVSCLYGARVVEQNIQAMPGLPVSRLPQYHLVPFRRWLLKQANFIDINVLAHRRRLPEARFTESFAQAADWDLILRLTRDDDPLMLPVVATFYSTSADRRLSDLSTAAAEARMVADVHRRRQS